jgi:asparagine synthase (glutamine-hydrolysing)
MGSAFTSDFCAVVSFGDAPMDIDPAPINRRTNAGLGKPTVQRHGRVTILLWNGRRMDASLHDTGNVTIVCRTDLIAPSRDNTASQIAEMYRQQGDRFVLGLRGSFAIILYDHAQNALKCWIDHFGIQKLVFTQSPRSLIVSTDLRLLECLMPEPGTIDPAAIAEYVTYTCIPTPRTIYKNISKLPPGNQLTYNSRLNVQTYWDMKYDSACHRKTEKAWAGETFDIVRASVARHTSELPGWFRLGCFLSGGTDSSSIAGLVGETGAEPARTFSIGFDDARYNEIHYARIAALQYRSKHHEYFVKPNDVLELLHKTASAFDEPFGNSSVIPTYYCARLAAEQGVTHLLAGDGGDELFGGNSRYVEDRAFQRYGRIPSWMRCRLLEPIIPGLATATNLQVFDLARRYINRSKINVPDRYFSYSLVSSVAPLDLFTPDFVDSTSRDIPLAIARAHFNNALADDDLNRWLYLDLKITIGDNDLRKVGTMCNLAGIKPQYPLLDPDLAEFTGRLPSNLKVRGSRLRYIFKKAMARILPPEIIKKTKHGFGLPYSVWVGEYIPLRDFTFDVLGSSRSRERGYFRRDLLEWLWSQYEQVHRSYYGNLLWLFLMLELWHVEQHDVRAPRDVNSRAIGYFA